MTKKGKIMGKIRVKAFGDEELEKKQKEEDKKRIEAKKAEKKPAVEETVVESATPQANEEEVVEKKKPVQKKNPSQKARSAKYNEKLAMVDRDKAYKVSEALAILPKINLAKFDETVELHINTTGNVSGAVTLPHGTGKQVRVAIADGSDTKAVEDLVKKIETGGVDFDVLVATPDAMPKLARVARVLGPRGLMPNPKNGTVTPKPDEVAKKFAGGQMNFKTEAKAPILHMVVGKMSFGDKKLEENIKVAFQAVQSKNVKNITLKSTMSPGLKLDLLSI
jgi:large subunit ribosomal protein L1